MYRVTIENFAKETENILGDNVVGVYLHGSMATQDHHKGSDIDIIVIVNKPLERFEEKAMIDLAMSMKELPNKGLEMSVVLKKYAHDFIHPCPFEVHYSLFHHDKYEKDASYRCAKGVDPDLAAHFTMIINRGRKVIGDDIETVFQGVSREDYHQAILYDLKEAIEDEHIDDYILLNVVRSLAYCQTADYYSKEEGAKWRCQKHPDDEIIRNSLRHYQEGINLSYRGDEHIQYAKEMYHHLLEFMK